MGPTVERSSLEVMLDSLRRKDENGEESMPALPARPVARGRLPSPKQRSVPAVGLYKGGVLRNGEEREGPKMMPELVSYEEERRPEPSTSDSMVVMGTVNVKKLDYVLRKDLRIWYCLPDMKWEMGKIESVSGDVALVKSVDGEVVTVSTENLFPANPDILNGVDDLIQLSYLNEPSVINNLQCRYSSDRIYTNAGRVLVAVNPYKELSLYGNDIIAAYRNKKLMDIPHVYGTADTAYSEMLRDGRNQSIIISGESGAGKTETAKYAMQCLAVLGSGSGSGSGLEEMVLQTNLILESFGNAKTLNNDNSTRFGKLTEIHFTADGKICGAKIETFLLEKSRVVQRAIGERSYHVLYQLCAGAPPLLKEKLNLRTADEYEYLKRSNCLAIAGFDDAQRFRMLMEALDMVKICKEDQENAFAMLAAVLWLGNIGFSVIDNENHVEVDQSEGVSNAARLMGCEVSDLMLALSTRTLKEDNECTVQKMALSEAIDARDALATLIYSSLFDWLVEQLNKSLKVEQTSAGRSISILDISGFESFNRNSFEQLCINYANERLQQYCNRHLFKLEREEYLQNGIDWTSVDLKDNIECLNLFEKKPLGLLSMLDEELTISKATDMTFTNKLKQHLSDNICFKGERGGAFRIGHFAGEVLYNTIGFLEKNRVLHHSESVKLLSSCSCKLSQLFASGTRDQLRNPGNHFQKLNGTGLQNPSVGTKFKDQLFKLMQRLESTTPHFIQCIKPNRQLLSGLYECDLVSQQLRSSGVLEAARISRSGYPTRMTHQQFAERYGFFLMRNLASEDPLSISVNVLRHFKVPPGMYQVGYMKIFFRTGQIASMEEVRLRTLRGIFCFQKHFRGLKARRYYQELKNGATVVHSITYGSVSTEHLDVVETSQMFEANHVNAHRNPDSKLQESVDNKEQSQALQAAVDDLQRQVLKAEAALKSKEEENQTLKQQIQQYETRWSDYETKMKSMEETWQKQMTSLQMSLAAAKKSLAVVDRENQPGRHDATPNYYDSEDLSAEFQTPEGTPAKQPRATAAVLPRNSEPTRNSVSNMVKDFEQQKKNFEDDAKILVEVKSGHSVSNMNPNEELQKLKVRFSTWKKDYKGKLRETKVELQKLGNSEMVKSRRKWWNIKGTR